MDGLGKEEVVSINAYLSGSVHPPKTTGEQFSNTFVCEALTGNGNEEYSLTNSKSKAYINMDSDGKTEIISYIICKFDGELVAMEVKVDPRSEINCIPLSHFRFPFPQLCRKDGNLRDNHGTV